MSGAAANSPEDARAPRRRAGGDPSGDYTARHVTVLKTPSAACTFSTMSRPMPATSSACTCTITSYSPVIASAARTPSCPLSDSTTSSALPAVAVTRTYARTISGLLSLVEPGDCIAWAYAVGARAPVAGAAGCRTGLLASDHAPPWRWVHGHDAAAAARRAATPHRCARCRSRHSRGRVSRLAGGLVCRISDRGCGARDGRSHHHDPLAPLAGRRPAWTRAACAGRGGARGAGPDPAPVAPAAPAS